MPRTIVYPHGPVDLGEGIAAEKSSDGYQEKIAKYVPAEVLAFFLPISSYVSQGTDTRLLYGTLVVGLIGTPLYLWLAAQNQSEDKKPRFYFYILAMIAFLAWAVGASRPTSTLLGMSEIFATWVLAVAVFLIPGIDEFLSRTIFK